jgi:hypothetical protein
VSNQVYGLNELKQSYDQDKSEGDMTDEKGFIEFCTDIREREAAEEGHHDNSLSI